MASTTDVISESFVHTALEKYFKRKIEILEFNAIDAAMTGDGVASKVKWISVTYTCENIPQQHVLRAIAKYAPEEGHLTTFLKEMRYFECELAVYESVLPRLEKFDYREKVAPPLYYSSLEPFPIVMLEDLISRNYKVLPRQTGLDLDHCLLVVKKLAYFHAASVALQEQDPTIFLTFNQTLYRNTEIMGLLISVCYDELVEVSRNVSELQQFSDKLKYGKNRILNRVFNVHNTNTKFKVLNHGDCWTTNFLFHYDNERKLNDVAFIDFQISCLSSPCLDLHYFLVTSPNLNTKQQGNIILDYYFSNLVSYLRKVGAKTSILREDFNEDFRQMAYYGFGATLVPLPFIMSDRKDGSVERIVTESGKDSFCYHCFNNEKYLKEIIHILPLYAKFGIFDE